MPRKNRFRIRLWHRVILSTWIISIGITAFANAAEPHLHVQSLWRYQSTRGSCEIACFAPSNGLLYVTVYNGIDVVDARKGTRVGSLDAAEGFYPTSVAYSQGRLAIAWATHDRRFAGKIELFDVSGDYGKQPSNPLTFAAGYLPDMLVFSPDGRYLLVANEGEPTDDLQFDPEGSITILDTIAGPDSIVVHEATFHHFDSQRDALRSRGVRIFSPSHHHGDRQATVSEDLEPEFIAISPDSTRAWVSLQENNALAEIDLQSAQVTHVHPLGEKQFLHAVAPPVGNAAGLWTAGLDASDADGGAKIRHWPLQGLYQPDGIAVYRWQGTDYLLTVNEGDPRKYLAFNECCCARDLFAQGVALDDRLRARLLLADNQLGRLEVSSVTGDTDGDGDLDQLCCFGARSMTLWKMNPSTAPELVFDSGNDFEWVTSREAADRYNADSTSDGVPDQRSPIRGPEPEGVAIGRVGRKVVAAIGLERTGGVMLYDITNPAETKFLKYLSPMDETGLLDCAPEGIVIVSAKDSPTGQTMLVVCNEGSGTVTTYSLAWSD